MTFKMYPYKCNYAQVLINFSCVNASDSDTKRVIIYYAHSQLKTKV